MDACSEDVARPFLSFMRSIGIGNDLLNSLCYEVSCRTGGDGVSLFCLDETLARFLKERISEEGAHFVLSAGVYLGKARDGFFAPSVSLAYLIAERPDLMMRTPIAVVKKGKELRFTHGKPLDKGDFLTERAGGKFFLVLSWRGEPIGWGFLSGERLVPLSDIGWFIRSGY